MPRTGRPSKFTPQLADEICARLASGETLTAICRDEAMPTRPTIHQWLIKPPTGGENFPAAYTRARTIGIDALVDQTLEIADDGRNDWIETIDGPRINQEVVQRSRLRVDTIKWLASKIAPKVYGERLELAGDKDAPLTITVKRLDR